MKAKIRQIFIIFVALILAGSSFATVMLGSADSNSQPGIQPAELRQDITVVQAQPVFKIAPTAPSLAIANSANCNLETSVQNISIQNPTGINLNQPAECFSPVKVVEANLYGQQLSVEPLHAFRNTVVVLPSAKIFPVTSIKAAPASQALAAMPVAVALSLVAFVLAGFSVKNLKRRFSLITFKQALTLEQLQVMRC